MPRKEGAYLAILELYNVGTGDDGFVNLLQGLGPFMVGSQGGGRGREERHKDGGANHAHG